MIRITNGCDWTNRYGEVKDVGFDGLRPNTTENARFISKQTSVFAIKYEALFI